jgi:inner membrane protein
VTPAPLNSLLWRIVAVGEEAHWEGYYTIGSGRPIELRRYDNDPALLRGIDERWAVRRLQRFTKGFYAVNERDGAVVITDLRMGVAGFYAFAFEVAERVDGRSVTRPDGRHAYPRPPLRAVVPEVLACALGRPTRFIRCR